MAYQPTDIVLDILKKIREEMAQFRASIEGRLAALEDLSRKQRRDTAGILVVGKTMVGDFTEQLAAVTERVDAIEARLP